MAEEILVGGEHLADALFHDLGVLFSEPGVVGVLEEFVVEVVREVRHCEVGLAFLICPLFERQHVVVHEAVATEEFVELLGLPLVRVEPYFNASQHLFVSIVFTNFSQIFN